MAKVTLTIEDSTGDDGGPELSISLAFEPMLERGQRMTPAQAYGAELGDTLAQGPTGETDLLSDWHEGNPEGEDAP